MFVLSKVRSFFAVAAERLCQKMQSKQTMLRQLTRSLEVYIRGDAFEGFEFLRYIIDLCEGIVFRDQQNLNYFQIQTRHYRERARIIQEEAPLLRQLALTR